MATTLSADAIRRIKEKRQSKVGKIYEQDNGYRFIGIKGGGLRRLTQAEYVEFTPTEDVSSTNVEEAISEIQVNTTEELFDVYMNIQKDSSVYFNVLGYDDDGNIATKTVYEDSSMGKRLYLVNYSYDGNGNIASINVLRDSDGYSITKTLEYDEAGNLVSTNVTN